LKKEQKKKIKQFTLGNVNFIAELINNKILSKKIIIQCIDHLFKNPTYINIEGIVILIDKFATRLNSELEKKLKPDEKREFNSKINDYLQKLSNTQEEGIKKIPGYIKYKIINLIEKKTKGLD